MLEPLRKVATLLSGSNNRPPIVGSWVQSQIRALCKHKVSQFGTEQKLRTRWTGTKPGTDGNLKRRPLGVHRCRQVSRTHHEQSIVGTTEQSGHFAQRFQQ